MSTLKELLEKASPRPWESVWCQRADGRIEFKINSVGAADTRFIASDITVDDAELVRRAVNNVEALANACEAAIRYDEAIRACADDPDKMASYCTAEGDDLDKLYDDWMSQSRAALAAVDGG